MSNIKELIRAEIERRKKEMQDKGEQKDLHDSEIIRRCIISTCNDLLSFLDTLPEEPEKPTRGYDEAYLNEKIAKASKSWKEVDVDKFMDEVRGREKTVTDCHDLEEAKEEYLRKARRTPGHEWMTRDIEEAFKAGAEWMKKQIPMPEDTVIFQKGVEEGKKLMMEGAVEGEVCILPGNVAYVKEKNNESLKQYLLDNFKAGDEARIIILPNDEDNDRTIV